MKKFLLIPVMFLCAVAAQAESAPKECEKQILHVSADVEIQVKPDRAHLSLGVHERSKDLRAAAERMSGTLKKAIAFCRANGVQDKHIQTSYLSIHPEYRYGDDKAKSLLQHYALTQNFTITLENPDSYETILYALLDMGINNVHNVSFTTSELRGHRDAARLAAVRAAREKAELLAGAAGISLGKAINIQEGRHDSLPAYRGRQFSRSQNTLHSPSAAPAADAGEGFALGMITIKAEVTVAYELD